MNALIAIGGLILLASVILYGCYCLIRSALVVGIICFLLAGIYISSFFFVTDVEIGVPDLDRYDLRVFPNYGMMQIYKPMRFYDVFINPWLTGTRCSNWVIK